MSIDYGNLAVAFRGKAEDLRALGPAAEKWLKKQDTADWDQALVEEIRSFAGMFALEGRDGGEAVLVETGAYFTHYVGYNLWCVNAMSKACPAVEVAAVTKVSNSVTDVPQWLSYFSPAGKKGIASGNSPDDMIWKGKTLMWPQGGDGKQYPFQFCRVEDYEGAVHELDVSMVRGNYNSGCTALVLRSPKHIWKFADVRLYFCDWYGDQPYPPIQADEKRCRELEERFRGVYACADFFGCAKEPGTGKWSWEDSEPMKELPDGALFFPGAGSPRGRKGFARNGKITRKKAVHRLDIFTRRVYNVRKYVIVCPGTSAVPTVDGGTVRARAAVSSKK